MHNVPEGSELIFKTCFGQRCIQGKRLVQRHQLVLRNTARRNGTKNPMHLLNALVFNSRME